MAIITRIPDAVNVISEERTQIVNEQEAFEQFSQRVAAIQPGESGLSVSTSPGMQNTKFGLGTIAKNGHSSSMDRLPQIREAYRETVMALPHYETEYGESIVENMSNEIGPSVTQAVLTGDVLSSQLKTTLQQKSLQAAKERSDFLSLLDYERDSVDTAHQSLRRIQKTVTEIDESLYPRPISEIVQSWERLEDLECNCKSILVGRQSAIHSTPREPAPHYLQGYLYRSREWTFPVLYDGLNVLAYTQDIKRKVCRAIYNW